MIFLCTFFKILVESFYEIGRRRGYEIKEDFRVFDWKAMTKKEKEIVIIFDRKTVWINNEGKYCSTTQTSRQTFTTVMTKTKWTGQAIRSYMGEKNRSVIEEKCEKKAKESLADWDYWIDSQKRTKMRYWRKSREDGWHRSEMRCCCKRNQARYKKSKIQARKNSNLITSTTNSLLRKHSN